MNEMLEPAMLIGLAGVAIWADVRFPRLRPVTLLRAALHVAFSFGVFATLPPVIRLLMPLVDAHALRLGIGLGLLIPTLTYLLLSWVWLLARILHLFDGPRGGHPVATDH
jgi:hypothetical protein